MLKKMPHLKVSFSINSLNESFRKDMDKASTIQERMTAMEELFHAGIHTVLFMSPIFPYLTDCKAIIDSTQNFVREYWFENLNLRGAYKKDILDYISVHYPHFLQEYKKIYIQKDTAYWFELENELDNYCKKLGIKYENYFYHEKLVKEKIKDK